MKEIRKRLVLDKLSYYETHLLLINCLLPVKMTPMELKVIALFMSLEGDIAQYRFGPSAKKIVMDQLEIKPSGLSNYLKALKQKGFLIERGDLITILPILEPEADEQLYLLKLEKQQENGTHITEST